LLDQEFIFLLFFHGSLLSHLEFVLCSTHINFFDFIKYYEEKH